MTNLHAQSGAISSTEWRHIRIDQSTRAQTFIDYGHHEIHAGSAYTSSKSFTHGAGASPNILMTVADNDKNPHLVFHVVSDSVLEVSLYESSGYSGGSALSSYNRNRNSSNTAGMVLATDATDGGSGKGTLIWTYKAGANKTVTTSEGERYEFILKRNAVYLLETVGSNGDLITALLDWYEHTALT